MMGKFRHYSCFPQENVISSLVPFVCFDCRKSFKKSNQSIARKCPQCRKTMSLLNHKFSAPKSSDIKQWEKIHFLVKNGFIFQAVYERIAPNFYKRVQYPRTMAEALDFVSQYKDQAKQL